MVLMNLFAGDGNGDTGNELVDTVGEGEVGTNAESSMETYTLPYVKQLAGENLLQDAGSSSLGFCDNLKGWDGVGGGREVQEEGDVCIPVADSY